MPDADKVLSQSEVDALLSAIGVGDAEAVPEGAIQPEAVPYDFKRPQRVSREQLRAIEMLHEAYARGLQAVLSGLLRTNVDVRVGRVEQRSFQEFIQGLPSPGVILVLSCDPLEGPFLFAMEPALAFPIIERLLASGRVSRSHPERPLTQVEWNLIDMVVPRMLDLMKEAWASVAPFQFRVAARETDPALIRVHGPNEAMVSVAFDVTLGEHKGTLAVALPVMAIEGHMVKLVAHRWLSSNLREPEPGQEAALSRQLAPAEVEVTVHLPAERMRLGALGRLRPGDILVTNHPHLEPVLVSIEGCAKFLARLGKVKDRKALKVTGIVEAGRLQPGDAPHTELTVREGEGEGPMREKAAADLEANLLGLLLPQSVVLAEKKVHVRDVVSFKVGEVIEFPKKVGEPLELRVGRLPLAEGAAVMIAEKFGLHLGAMRRPVSRPSP